LPRRLPIHSKSVSFHIIITTNQSCCSIQVANCERNLYGKLIRRYSSMTRSWTRLSCLHNLDNVCHWAMTHSYNHIHTAKCHNYMLTVKIQSCHSLMSQMHPPYPLDGFCLQWCGSVTYGIENAPILVLTLDRYRSEWIGSVLVQWKSVTDLALFCQSAPSFVLSSAATAHCPQVAQSSDLTLPSPIT